MRRCRSGSPITRVQNNPRPFSSSSARGRGRTHPSDSEGEPRVRLRQVGAEMDRPLARHDGAPAEGAPFLECGHEVPVVRRGTHGR